MGHVVSRPHAGVKPAVASAPSPRLPSGRLRPSEPVIGPAKGRTRWTGYGEGRGEGSLPQSQTRGDAPSPDLSPQAGRGEGCGQFQGPFSTNAGGENGELPSPALYRLMTWMSPAYPVGAFSYSGGLEWAVEAGDIRDACSLTGWLTTIICNGGAFCDAAIFCHAHPAAACGDDHAVSAACRRRSAPRYGDCRDARRGVP